MGFTLETTVNTADLGPELDRLVDEGIHADGRRWVPNDTALLRKAVAGLREAVSSGLFGEAVAVKIAGSADPEGVSAAVTVSVISADPTRPVVGPLRDRPFTTEDQMARDPNTPVVPEIYGEPQLTPTEPTGPRHDELDMLVLQRERQAARDASDDIAAAANAALRAGAGETDREQAAANAAEAQTRQLEEARKIAHGPENLADPAEQGTVVGAPFEARPTFVRPGTDLPGAADPGSGDADNVAAAADARRNDTEPARTDAEADDTPAP